MVTVVQPLLTERETEALIRILEYLADEKTDYTALPPDERTKHIYHSVLMLRKCGLFYKDQFDLGKTCSTPGAVAALERANQQPWDFLSRHVAGDWGDVCQEDWQENDFSLERGFRLLSVYRTATDERLWVITEADRSVTTLLLPQEY